MHTFNTLISMVTLIIDSCCDFVKTSDVTHRGGLKQKQHKGQVFDWTAKTV